MFQIFKRLRTKESNGEYSQKILEKETQGTPPDSDIRILITKVVLSMSILSFSASLVFIAYSVHKNQLDDAKNMLSAIMAVTTTFTTGVIAHYFRPKKEK